MMNKQDNFRSKFHALKPDSDALQATVIMLISQTPAPAKP